MKVTFVELVRTTNGFPILHLSFKLSRRFEAAYFQGNQFPDFRPKESK